MAEFIACFHPECRVSGRPIRSVCFKGVAFDTVSRHPATGVVVSVSDAAAKNHDLPSIGTDAERHSADEEDR